METTPLALDTEPLVCTSPSNFQKDRTILTPQFDVHPMHGCSNHVIRIPVGLINCPSFQDPSRPWHGKWGDRSLCSSQKSQLQGCG